MDKAKETRRKNTYVDLINGLLAWMLTHRRCSKKLIVQIGIYIKIIKALIKIELLIKSEKGRHDKQRLKG